LRLDLGIKIKFVLFALEMAILTYVVIEERSLGTLGVKN